VSCWKLKSCGLLSCVLGQELQTSCKVIAPDFFCFYVCVVLTSNCPPNRDGGVSYKMASLVPVSRKRLASAESAFLCRSLILPYNLSPPHNCRNYIRLWCGHYAYRSYQSCSMIHRLFSTNIFLCYYSDDSVLLLNYGDLRAGPTRAEARLCFQTFSSFQHINTLQTSLPRVYLLHCLQAVCRIWRQISLLCLCLQAPSLQITYLYLPLLGAWLKKR